MIAAVILIAIAAFRAQTAYQHRLDGRFVQQPHVNSAIRLGLVGLACFIGTKVMA